MLYIGVLLTLLGVFGRIVEAQLLPTVVLDDATVTGVTSGITNRFLGIPYAEPPTGNLRFRLPQALPPYNTSFSAVEYGPTCPQQPFTHLPPDVPGEVVDHLSVFLMNDLTSAEDCLTLNVIIPFDATPDSKLPVVVWFFPSGFEWSGTALYDGNVIVEKSILLGVPAVYVSMNTRQNAFGFLASKEVKDAGVGNIGLQDQILALRWVQKYINAFGGDPTKVTIWGESSGAISIALLMLMNGGNPDGLFRAAFMQSGAATPLGDITLGQPYYDTIVSETGCSNASDTLQCLREVPYESLLNAIGLTPGLLSYQSLDLAWRPRLDGVLLTAEPTHLIQQGMVADVPFISGNCDDEGTFFSLVNTNVTTDAEFKEYIKMYLPFASDAMIAKLMEYYPSDPTKGSPYDTGYLNMLTLQFKRMASLAGDAIFQAPRRFLLDNQAGKQKIWTYLNKRLKPLPFLGSFHWSDVYSGYYAGTDMTSYLVRFVANLDPNEGGGVDLYWPPYDATDKTMLQFSDPFLQTLTSDTYRDEEMAYLVEVISETQW